MSRQQAGKGQAYRLNLGARTARQLSQRLVPRAESHLFQETIELVPSRRHCRLGPKLGKVRMGPRRH